MTKFEYHEAVVSKNKPGRGFGIVVKEEPKQPGKLVIWWPNYYPDEYTEEWPDDLERPDFKKKG